MKAEHELKLNHNEMNDAPSRWSQIFDDGYSHLDTISQFEGQTAEEMDRPKR